MACPKDDTKDAKPLSQTEELEQACWNGELSGMLPEICGHTAEGKDLYLWDIKEGASFLSIDLGEVPTEKDSYFSIDPYKFVADQHLS